MSVTAQSARWSSTMQPAPWITEDWLSVWIGLGIFILALGGLRDESTNDSRLPSTPNGQQDLFPISPPTSLVGRLATFC